MEEYNNFNRIQKIANIFYQMDRIICLILVIFLVILFIMNYNYFIIRNRYIESISILSSIIGFVFGFILLLKIKELKLSLQLSLFLKKACINNGFIHLFCSFILIYYYINHVGNLQVVLGHIYRDYGYLHLFNVIFYFGIFGYFKRFKTQTTSDKGSIKKEKPLIMKSK
jgi:hypothetical protein